MSPAQLTATCGTVLALCLASPALAQNSQPERPQDHIRLAQPTRTPNAREVNATAAPTDTALALYEGVWKVDVVMMHGQDPSLTIPGTTPNSTPNTARGTTGTSSPSSRVPTDRDSYPSTRPTEPLRTLPERTYSSEPVRPTTPPDGSVGDSPAILQGSTFSAYSECHAIMNGNVLQETMMLPRDALMLHNNGTPTTSRTDVGSSAAVPEPVAPGRDAARNPATGALSPSMPEDSVTVRSFLSLDADYGTFTRVCMDEESGRIKHETGTYETQSDRMVFVGHSVEPSAAYGPGSQVQPVAPDANSSNTSRRARREKDAPSAISDPTNRDPTSDISGRSSSDSAPTPRGMNRSTTPQNGWDTSWGSDCRVVVDFLGPDERRVTVYKIDSSMPDDLILGAPEGADNVGGATGESTRMDDQVRAKTLGAGRVVCQATYTRVSDAESESIRQLLRDRSTFAAGARD